MIFALGILSVEGPLHGHAIRRRAEAASADRWGGVNPGALHRELRQLAAEALIEEVRSEQAGRRPARTIYAITAEGGRELAVLRDKALRDTHVAADPVRVALLFGGRGSRAERVSIFAHLRSSMPAVGRVQME